ncbi:class I SAM-dependent methyltransferase [Desulfatibacillum aliphaticivorans]|uniref:class I SAM-dependent methyltransferase n=1 Tax=Desulfatibacillum aliphaticivorans TaxID=218208 RepID=UPI00041F48B3|nr:class I SAM-dependent methyltransferase [Desulfatibacillum aliphaticivorans]
MSGILSKIWDATARIPSGRIGRLMYKDPKGHYPGFRLILEKLEIGPDDVFCEVGCGGGALLKMVLETASRAAGLDLSPDMAALARKQNREAVESGRLEVLEGDAENLPWDDEKFTCLAAANVFFFLPRPDAALREFYRVQAPPPSLLPQGYPKNPWMPKLD